MIKWADTSEYNGEMSGGYRHGQGKMVFANGSKYTGGWMHDLPHGEGALENVKNISEGRRYSEDGELVPKKTEGGRSYEGSYEGQWVDGVPHGVGSALLWDHCRYQGEWALGA